MERTRAKSDRSRIESGAGRGSSARASADGSRGGPGFLADFRRLNGRTAAVLVLGMAAGILMIAAELSALYSIEIAGGRCQVVAPSGLADECEKTGGERHLYGFVLLALLTFVMTWGVTAGRSRPAAVALIVAGAVVIAIAIVADLPDVDEEGLFARTYRGAEANPGPGLWLELAGGALALLAGALALARR